MYERLSGSLPVSFLYNILVLNFQGKGNQPQKITLMNFYIMQYSYPDCIFSHSHKKRKAIVFPFLMTMIQHCLLKVLPIKKIIKICLSMTENIATDATFLQVAFSHFLLGCTQIWTFIPLAIPYQVQPSVKIFKRYLTAWPHTLIQFLVKDLLESFINCTKICATYGTLSVHSQGALKNNL